MELSTDIVRKVEGVAVVIAIVNLCHSDDSITKVEFFGQAAMQAGQFVNYKYRTVSADYPLHV